jgi:hypothetical protein
LEPADDHLSDSKVAKKMKLKTINKKNEVIFCIFNGKFSKT